MIDQNFISQCLLLFSRLPFCCLLFIYIDCCPHSHDVYKQDGPPQLKWVTQYEDQKNESLNMKTKKSCFAVKWLYFFSYLQTTWHTLKIKLSHFFFSCGGPSWLWWYGSCIYNYICNQCLSPLTLWVRIPVMRGELDTTLCSTMQWLSDQF
jgi:hypothetical protein